MCSGKSIEAVISRNLLAHVVWTVSMKDMSPKATPAHTAYTCDTRVRLPHTCNSHSG